MFGVRGCCLANVWRVCVVQVSLFTLKMLHLTMNCATSIVFKWLRDRTWEEQFIVATHVKQVNANFIAEGQE